MSCHPPVGGLTFHARDKSAFGGRSFGKDIQWFKFVMEWPVLRSPDSIGTKDESMTTPRTMDKKDIFNEEEKFNLIFSQSY